MTERPWRRATPARWRPRIVLLAAVTALSAPLLTSCGGPSAGAGAPVINYYNNPGTAAATQSVVDMCTTRAHGKYRIVYHKLPAGADGQRQQMVRRLAAHDSAMDLLGLDVTWEAEFAEAGWIRPWTGQYAARAERVTLPGPLKTARWHGKLVAVPVHSNSQLLWYRSDLVSHAPRTWAEMIGMAKRLAEQGKPHRIEIQGAQYEGLTVWFNTLVESAGGSVLGKGSKAPSLGMPARQAMTTMRDLATSVAADPSLSNQKEDQNRLAMENGRAAFELNWPFVWASMQKDDPVVNGKHLKDAFRWAPYPRMKPNEPAHVTIGGVDLAVSSYSPHPKLAFAAAACMSGEDAQRILAFQGGQPPVAKSFYESPSPQFTTKFPFYELVGKQLASASVRPKTPAYQSVSIAISHRLSPPAGISPKQDEPALKEQISQALQSKGLIP